MLSTSAASALIVASMLLVPLAARQSGRDVGCSDWRGCRQVALAAADGGDYERFHDLAWRAVQLGPPKDPALLALLARAQALSGRPHDALVMLDRLADMGVAVDADSSDEFARTRQLPGWPEVSAHIDRVRRAGVPAPAAAAALPPGSARSPAAAAAPAPTPAPAAPAPRPATLEAVRFSTGAFTPGGLAYDAVSGRFLFADRVGRKLFIVSEQSNRATDFVRGDSAGFQEIAAIEIDTKRGDLWVASTAPAEGSGTLHKLQLISGRVLRSFSVAADLQPLTLVDLAVTQAGAVLALDSTGRQLLVLRPGATAPERVLKLEASEPVSLAAGGDEGVAYVATRGGVLRVDLRARTAAPLSAAKTASLDHLERIRWHDRALIAVRLDADGSRSIVRIDLNAAGRGVVKETTIERAVPIAAPAFVTFRGDELVFLADGSSHGEGPPEFVAYRLRLR